MVSSTGTLVNRDSTSNETSENSSELSILFIKSGKVDILMTVTSFLAKGLRYFTIK